MPESESFLVSLINQKNHITIKRVKMTYGSGQEETITHFMVNCNRQSVKKDSTRLRVAICQKSTLFNKSTGGVPNTALGVRVRRAV